VLGGLSNRELMLIEVRAIDAGASSTINRVGAATAGLTSVTTSGSLKLFAYSHLFGVVGQAATRAGTALLGVSVAAGKLAMDFDHAMGLVQTQAHLSQKAFEDLSSSVLDTSSKYGVAATQIASGLYDIFSTTNQTAKQAKVSIDTLAKASVAGAIDMSTATRGVVDIQNAFGKAAGTTTDVLNLQFQMLRKSAGTYPELVSAFGNVISAASQMDQTLQTAAGSIAFLTLRGRTQAQASISVSRALDQLSKSAKDVKSTLGVDIFTATGDFKQLNDIITEMSAKMAGMTSKERAQAFYDMFGAGSIQANRFFRIAIPQADKLNESIGEMSKTQIAGQLQKAFNIMRKNDPSYIFHKLTESLKNLGISIANTLAPAFQSVVKDIQKVVDWFNNLSDATKESIGRWVILSGAILLVTGIVLKFVSTIMFMTSIMKLAGQGAGGLFSILTGASLGIVGTVAAVIALAGAAYLIYKNWGPITDWWERNWNKIKYVVETAVAAISVILAVKLVGSIKTAATAVKGLGVVSNLMGVKMENSVLVAKGALGKLAIWIKEAANNFGYFVKGQMSFRQALNASISKTLAFGIALTAVVVASKAIYDLVQQQSGHREDYVKMIGLDSDKLAEAQHQLALLRTEIDNTGYSFRKRGLMFEADALQKGIDEAKQKIKDFHYANAQTIQGLFELGKGFQNAKVDASSFALDIESITGVSEKYKESVARNIGALTALGGKMGESRQKLVLMYLAQIHNLRVQGDQNAANKKAGELNKLLAGWIDKAKDSLKNYLPPQKQADEKAADWAFHMESVNRALVDNKKLLDGGLGALRHWGSAAAQADAKAADLAFHIQAINSALNNTPPGRLPSGGGGGSGGGDGGGGGGGGGGRNSGPPNPVDRTVVHIHTSRVADDKLAREIARELDWEMRRRGR
jgi:TP901 family phage tail tape measure protein